MEWGIKIIVMTLIIIVFFLVVVGLVTMWSGQSNDLANGIYDFLRNLGTSAGSPSP